MGKKKLDRRVRRTRRLLGEALIALIIEQPYETITITDITDRADLNRATFYLHYGSKEELLADTLEGQFDELVERMNAVAPEIPIWRNNRGEELIFEHVAEHVEMYKALLGENGVGYVAHSIIRYIARTVLQKYDVQLPPNFKPAIPFPILAQHVAGALFAQISWWVENDMPYSPAYMAEAVNRLCLNGMGILLEPER